MFALSMNTTNDQEGVYKAMDRTVKGKRNEAKTAPNASFNYEGYISLSIGTRGVMGILNWRASLSILEMKFLRRMS